MDPSSHYLRLRVWTNDQMLYYVPKPEEDISDLVRTGARGMGQNTCLSCLCYVLLFLSLEVELNQRRLAGNEGSPPNDEVNSSSGGKPCDEDNLWICVRAGERFMNRLLI